jgi:hypothetical protein
MKKVKGAYTFAPEEKEEFNDLFPFTANRHISFHFGCSQRTVIRLARKFGLQKDEYFRLQFNWIEIGRSGSLHPNSKSTRFQPGKHHSENTEYKPGHVPWIKGKTFSERFMYSLNKKSA